MSNLSTRFLVSKGKRGFTLLELIVTVALAAILLGLAIPSFTGLFERNRLATVANSLVGDLMTARAEAIKRNVTVSICHSNDGSSCGGAWKDGRIVFLDENGNGSVDSEDEVLQVNEGMPGKITLIGSADEIIYMPSGMLKDESTVDFSIQVGTVTKYCVKVEGTGRPLTKEGGC